MELRFDCPVCPRAGKAADKKRHLYVNPARNRAHCFRCGFGTTHAKEFCERHGIRLDEALWRVQESEQLAARRCLLPDEYRTQWTASLLGRQALHYLTTKRRLDRITVAAYELGYCEYGPYAQRVIVPIYEDGEVVHFVGRDWTEIQVPKYLGPKGTGGGRLFNLDRAAKSRVLVLVEGVFDALRLPRFGVALLGKQLQEAQRTKIFAVQPAAIFIALDADAQEEARKIYGQLAGCSVPTVQDIGSIYAKFADLGASPQNTVEAICNFCQSVSTNAGRVAKDRR